MATGIPGTNGKVNGTNGTGFRLDYAHKTPASEVIKSTPSAQVQTVVEVPGQPVNRLIYGDNLRVLRSLLDDPSVAGKVTLVYIDPPFATKSRFESRKQRHAYDDALAGAEYLEFLRQRLILLRELLADNGSIYLHLDDNMAFTAKLLLDEVFGSDNFRNFITRKKCNPKNYTRKTFGNLADYVLFYSKGPEYTWNQQFDPFDEDRINKEYRYVEKGTGRRYMKVPIHAPGVRNGATGEEWRGMMPPPGKHWQYTPNRLDEMDARGEISWSKTGNPRRKVYLDDRPGIAAQDIWLDYKDAHNQNICITGYPTEKNPDLLRRIINASSDPGDLVLDAFGGSGTTGAVAEAEGRRWVMIDNSPLAMETMVWRLARGTEPMGDFVKKKKRRREQTSFLTRVLQNGLTIGIEDEDGLEAIPAAQVDEWKELLS